MKHATKEKAIRMPVEHTSSGAVPSPSTTRRAFLGTLGAATLGAAVLPSPAAGEQLASVQPADASGAADARVRQATNLRIQLAIRDGRVPAGKNVTNGDEYLYPDKAGTYTKGLAHDNFGRVDPTSFASFKQALNSGKFEDFEKIIMGGTRTLNGPQGGLCFDLCALDNAQYGQPQVPPAPATASHQNATELLEHYWGSLLRDVAFTDYGSNPLAAMAAAELGSQPSYRGPRDSRGYVTPHLLFRGSFPGETLGPYISQFFIQPTSFGAQPLSQQMVTYRPEIDYMTSFDDWLAVQNGDIPGPPNQTDNELRYQRNGRDLAAYTHVDVLYQAYFTAFLVLAGMGAPRNPGNPYIGSRTENGFGTLGGPDFAGCFGEVATKALNAVWYQKWFVHLRPRPEAHGGLVHLIKTGHAGKTDATFSPFILDSQGLKKSFDKYGSWLLSQAFPEGSPYHPAYPTGHGTVAGACITMLKFFFDGNFRIPDPVVPSSDGLSLVPYTGLDAAQLTVNGELNKLGHNVSFGHGIHAGIHWRSDTDTSLLLGEAVALSYLQDKAQTYNEPFTIHLAKFDGTTATVSNEGNP